MMNKMESVFNPDDLIKATWQYIICHLTIDCFKIGEIIFLKSNPEYPMIMLSSVDNKIICEDLYGNYEIPPQCLLQYKYASMLKHENIEININ